MPYSYHPKYLTCRDRSSLLNIAEHMRIFPRRSRLDPKVGQREAERFYLDTTELVLAAVGRPGRMGPSESMAGVRESAFPMGSMGH